MKTKIPAFRTDEKRLELRRRLNDTLGINLPADKIAGKPGFPLTVLTTNDTLIKFLQTIAWTIEEIKAAQS